jgi:hypothetical protein
MRGFGARWFRTEQVSTGNLFLCILSKVSDWSETEKRVPRELNLAAQIPGIFTKIKCHIRYLPCGIFISMTCSVQDSAASCSTIDRCVCLIHSLPFVGISEEKEKACYIRRRLRRSVVWKFRVWGSNLNCLGWFCIHVFISDIVYSS